MILPDREACGRALALVLGAKVVVAEGDRYWAALEDLHLADVEDGCAALAKTWRGRFYPKPADVRAAAQAVAVMNQRPMTGRALASVAAGERYCPQCDDTGWVVTQGSRLAALAQEARDRARPYGFSMESLRTVVDAMRFEGKWAHPAAPDPPVSVRACGCRGQNPLYQAKRASAPRITRSGWEGEEA